MTTNPPVPPGWYPDQSRRFEVRYWDGAQWTPHVATAGQQYVDVPPGTAPVTDQYGGPGQGAPQAQQPQQVQQQVQQQDRPPEPTLAPLVVGSGSIFTEPMLIVDETVNTLKGNSFAVRNGAGTQIATALEGGSTGSRLLGTALKADKYMKQRLEVTDAGGRVLLVLTRPAKVMKSRLIVADGRGFELGVIRQESVVGSVTFALEVGPNRIGTLAGKSWLGSTFVITDAGGSEVARIDKGLPPDAVAQGVVKGLLTGADAYVLQVQRPLPEPLRFLVVASVFAIDTALHQN